MPERITHGRHCTCSSCAREDWTRIIAPCGMHGKDCPPVYAPLGGAGDLVNPPVADPSVVDAPLPHDIPEHIVERMYAAAQAGHERVCLGCGTGNGAAHFDDCTIAPPAREPSVVDALDTLREALGVREWSASITPTDYGREVEAKMPETFAALAVVETALAAAHNTCGTCGAWSGTTSGCEECAEFMQESGHAAKWSDDVEAAEAERDTLRQALERGVEVAAQYMDTERGDLDGWIDRVRAALGRWQERALRDRDRAVAAEAERETILGEFRWYWTCAGEPEWFGPDERARLRAVLAGEEPT